MCLRSHISFALLLTALGTNATAQTAADIISRHIEAIGGQTALDSIESMRYERRVQNTIDSVTTLQSHQVIHRKRPYFYRTDNARTARIYVSDGSDGWSGRYADDADSISWREASFVLRSRDLDTDQPFGSFIDFVEKGHGAEYLGVRYYEGKSFDIVRVWWKEGEKWDYYFDASTGLCYGYVTNPDQPENLLRVDDYRRVGLVLVPHRHSILERLEDGSRRLHERIYFNFEFNIELDEAFFRPGQF